MAVELGKNLISSILNLGSTGKAEFGTAVNTTPAYKTTGYASIPYARFPQVKDTVPTKGLLPGYDTPNQVWVA